MKLEAQEVFEKIQKENETVKEEHELSIKNTKREMDEIKVELSKVKE